MLAYFTYKCGKLSITSLRGPMHVFGGDFKEDEIYWPAENESLTFGHTTVTHRGTECKGDNTRIALEVERFKQVMVSLFCCMFSMILRIYKTNTNMYTQEERSLI